MAALSSAAAVAAASLFFWWPASFAASALPAAGPPRITISGGSFWRGGAEVALLGGNYVFKAQPYLPDAEVVARDARDMAVGAAAMRYRPSDNRTVVPVVRLGALFEAFMPSQAGVADPDWQSRLEATVEAFGKEGVYVLLDVHQDGLATTNGGEGFPWWMTAKMQETAASVPGCWLCSSSTSYITSPKHPLKLAVPGVLQRALKEVGVHVRPVKILNETDPWLAYSVGGDAGDPRRMNVGNLNMRANNNDGAWSQGTLILSRQVQNVAWRLYRSHKYPSEKAAFFDHYVTFVKYLCSLWERYSNVVAIELLNEPPLGGIPDVTAAARSRTDLFDFYAAVLQELEREATPTKAPIAVEDVFGTSLQPVAHAVSMVFGLDALSSAAAETLKRWTTKDQLVVSFHWYPANHSESSLKEYIQGAGLLASELGSPPIWLSEYFSGTVKETAYYLSLASELGCRAVTYWHYANTDFTQTGGWFKYPPEVVAEGGLFNGSGSVNLKAWSSYEKTIADGTFWGADINGAGGGKMHVLESVPQVVRGAVRVAGLEPEPSLGSFPELLV